MDLQQERRGVTVGDTLAKMAAAPLHRRCGREAGAAAMPSSPCWPPSPLTPNFPAVGAPRSPSEHPGQPPFSTEQLAHCFERACSGGGGSGGRDGAQPSAPAIEAASGQPAEVLGSRPAAAQLLVTPPLAAAVGSTAAPALLLTPAAAPFALACCFCMRCAESRTATA